MQYWSYFLTGLTTGGFTCAAMQGALLASLITNQKKLNAKSGFGFDDWGPVTAFLVAKTISHSIFGLLLGLLGSYLTLSLGLRLFFQGATALFLLFTAFNLLDFHPIFRHICFRPPQYISNLMHNSSHSILIVPAIFGLLTIFIPCSVTQAIMLSAINSASPITGSLVMSSYTIGTVPLFLAIGIGTARFSEIWRRDFLRLAAVVLIYTALASLNGILLVLDSPLSLQCLGPKIVRLLPPYEQNTKSNYHDPNVRLVNNVQKIKITINEHGYIPQYFRVKKGIPVELTLETDGAVYSCATSFSMKAFEIYETLKPVDSKVNTFTPEKVGKFTFSCSMGAYSGIMEVIQ